MIARTAIALVLILGTGMYARHAGGAEASVDREPLTALPLALEGWHGRDAQPLADDVLGTLGVDDYVNRQYVRANAPPIGLYAGYYASQRQGDTIHSPQNCLPGAGWRPIEAGVVDLRAGPQTVRVNRFVIQKGMDRQLVYYWYQGRGRIIANEYANKLLLMYDAARLNRTNGGLVRLITPIPADVSRADTTLSAFAAALLPRLDMYLP